MDAEIDANASAANDNNPLLLWWIDFLCVVGPSNVVCHTIVPLLIDVNALSLWLTRRQFSYKDGFCADEYAGGWLLFLLAGWGGSVLDSWLQANAKGKRSGDITSTTIIRNSIAIDASMIHSPLHT
jgi:hypothetical protein